MIKISISPFQGNVLMTKDNEDAHIFDGITAAEKIDSVLYCFTQYTLDIHNYEKIIYIPVNSAWSSCWKHWTKIVELLYYLQKYFNAHNIKYQIEMPKKLSITNMKGKTYAYLL